MAPPPASAPLACPPRNPGMNWPADVADALPWLAALAAPLLLLYFARSRRDAGRRQRQLDFTRAITASLGEGLYSVDRDGRVTSLNPAGEALLGWSEAELLGKSVHDAVHFQRADGSRVPAADCPLLAAAR